LVAFKAAAKMQETKSFLSFSDPPAFWYPVRRDMAAALLAMGKPKDALREAERTLRTTPKEPVTLALKAEAEAKLGLAASAAGDRSLALALWHGDRRLLPDATIQMATR
jgi:predicted Zn-dependent protease